MSFGEKILNYKDDILIDLTKVVSIDSVSVEGEEKPQQALKYMLERAESMGLVTKNIDNIVGHIQYGTGKKLCGVLTHLDVVPAGEGWTCDPFTLTRKNGRIYGRGVADDKGSAVVAMYCLKALKDNNIISDSTIRLILGTNEETGMTDVEHYFSKEPLPYIGFTPDSDYGICSCEKGILQFSLKGSNKNSIIKKACGGSAVNAVPDKTIFTLSENISIDQDEQAFEVTFENNMTKLISKGKASHAMEPNKGFNSITYAVEKLSKSFGNNNTGDVFAFIHKYISTSTDGSFMGLKQSDSRSGELTLNVGVINADENSATVKIDIRYPVSADYENIIKTISQKANEFNLELNIDNHSKPLDVPENSEIISILKKSYKEVMGENPNIYSTGGGTYARSLANRGVAFGPVFPDDFSNMHRPDESLNEEKFFLHAQICLEAMYRMFTE